MRAIISTVEIRTHTAMQVEPFAVGTAVDVGRGVAVVRGAHAVLVGVGDIGVEFLDSGAEGDGCTGRVEGPEESGHEKELDVVAVDGLVKGGELGVGWQTCRSLRRELQYHIFVSRRLLSRWLRGL